MFIVGPSLSSQLGQQHFEVSLKQADKQSPSFSQVHLSESFVFL